MKKVILALVLLTAVGVCLYPNIVKAGGPAGANIDFAPSPGSGVADGQSAMTMSIYAYDYRCTSPDTYGSYPISLDPDYCASHGYGTANKEGVYLSNLTASLSGSGNEVTPASFDLDSSGHGSFSIKSSVAETKTLKILGYSGSYEYGATTVTFTASAPAATAPTQSTPKQTAPTAAPKTTTPSVAPPSTPALATIKTGTTAVDANKPITIEQSQPLMLSGTTVPDGVVTLTIHSTPKTVTTTADKDGHWTYEVKDLEAGDHYIEATVTDPTTNQASPVAKLVSFTVKAKPVTATTMSAAAPSKKSSKLMIVIIAVVGILALAGGGWYFWRRKKRGSDDSSSMQTPKDPATS